MKRKIYRDKQDATVKRFVMGYLYITASVLLCVLLITAPYLYPILRYTFVLLLLLQIASICLSYYLSLEIIRLVAHLYIIASTLLLLPAAFLMKNEMSVCLWYIVMPLMCSVVFPKRRIVSWSLFCLSLLLVAGIGPNVLALNEVDLSHYVFMPDFGHDRKVNTMYVLSNTVVLLSVFGVVCHSLYYRYKLQQIREEEWREGVYPNGENEPVRKNDLPDGRKDYKYDEVYGRIMEYFESRQPFINPNFNIAQLATALDINTTYLSSAIRIKRNMNFSLFVNTFRIEKVKNMILDTSNKYTLEHLYLSSGFRNQSTFNKAFKTCEGVTPTEYIKSKALPTSSTME